MPQTEKFSKENNETRTIIEWSEFHYHLFSHLIGSDCPRDLAENIELYLFPNSWIPDHKRLEQAIAAIIDSDDPEICNTNLKLCLETWKAEGLQANGPTLPVGNPNV